MKKTDNNTNLEKAGAIYLKYLKFTSKLSVGKLKLIIQYIGFSSNDTINPLKFFDFNTWLPLTAKIFWKKN